MVKPDGAMVTSSDPYRDQYDTDLGGNMTFPVMHAMSENNSIKANEKNYKAGTFNQAIVKQSQIDSNGDVVDSIALDQGSNSWRGALKATSNSWVGFLNGFLNIDDGYSQTIEGRLEIDFDSKNDRLIATLMILGSISFLFRYI